jgi:hypothetical protein
MLGPTPSGQRRDVVVARPTCSQELADQGEEVARLLGRCWPLENARRRTRRCFRAFPAAERVHKRQEARRGRRPLDAKPTRASRPHRLAVACSRLIHTRAIPKDGAARAAAPNVTEAQRVRPTAAYLMLELGRSFKRLWMFHAVPQSSDDAPRRRCVGAGDGGSVVVGGRGDGAMDTLRLALYM